MESRANTSPLVLAFFVSHAEVLVFCPRTGHPARPAGRIYAISGVFPPISAKGTCPRLVACQSGGGSSCRTRPLLSWWTARPPGPRRCPGSHQTFVLSLVSWGLGRPHTVRGLAAGFYPLPHKVATFFSRFLAVIAGGRVFGDITPAYAASYAVNLFLGSCP